MYFCSYSLSCLPPETNVPISARLFYFVLTGFTRKNIFHCFQADVLVNSVDGTDLSRGQISSFLLGKAGPGLQEELNQSGQTLYVGELAETGGHQLNIKKVYHINPGDYYGPKKVIIMPYFCRNS